VLDPAAPLWRRDAEHLQIGTDPQDAVVVRDVAGLLDLVRRCDGVRRVDEVLSTAPPGRQSALAAALDALLDAGVLVDADSASPLGAAAGELARLTGADLAAAQARATVSERSRRKIGLVGPRVLTAPLGALLADCGAPALPGQFSGMDLVVLAGRPEPDRRLADACARDDVPHVVMSLQPRSALPGPMVLPGRTACLRCADETRADTDPAWAALVAQLDSPVQRPAGALAAEGSPLLVATLVAATAAAVLAMIDGLATGYDGSVRRWAAACEAPSVERLAPHPRCGCLRLG
jgi:hypothetical protein